MLTTSVGDHLQEAFDDYASVQVATAIAPLNDQVNQLSSALTQANANLVDLQSKYNIDEQTIAALRAQLAQSTLPSLPAGFNKALFVDTFDGDLSKWNVQDGTTQNNTYCNNWARNVAIRNGQLVITALSETTTGNKGRVCQYSAGYIDTINKFSFGPPSPTDAFAVEIRAKLPTPVGSSAGIWPAAWLRNQGLGEFDIFEAWGEPVTTKNGDVYRSGSFSSSAYANTNSQVAGKLSNWGTAPGTAPVANAFHTWLWTWDFMGMKCYFDSSPVPYLVVPSNTPWYSQAFATAFHMRLNLQIGSDYWGMPTSATKWPAEFIVDYVRVSSK